jgi:hypothetical protein
MYLSLLISLAVADEPQFTFLSENQTAPFEGVLFNPPAVADLLVKPKELQLQCDLNMEYELSAQAAEYDLRLSNEVSRHEALEAEYRLTVMSKDSQIENLKTIVKRNSPVSNWVWFVGGSAVGAAMTYGAYRVFNVQ